MVMKVLYIIECIYILSRFINSIKDDNKATEIIASLMVYGSWFYFMFKVFKFIF